MEENKGLDIKAIWDKVLYFWKDVWKYKLWIVLSSIVFGAILVLQAWLTPRYYPAPLTFMVNTDEGGAGGGMMAVLGEFGMGGGGGGSNYEKIGALAKSRKIIEQTLKTEVTYADTNDYLGNILLNEYEVTFDKESLNTIRFNDSITIEIPGYEEVLKKIYVLVVGTKDTKGLLVYDYDDESTLMTLKTLCKTPELSILLAETHYKKLSGFYIENNISKQQKTFQQVNEKADSIFGALRSAEYQLANYADASKGIMMYKQRLPAERLAKKVEMLYMMYGEALKNKETAQFLLNNATPYFQVIDTPIEPIQVQGKSRATGLIKGGLIGLLLGIGLVVGRKWLIDELGN